MPICTKHTESSCATGVSFSMRNSKDWCKELLKSCEQYAAVNYSVKWVTEGPWFLVSGHLTGLFWRRREVMDPDTWSHCASRHPWNFSFRFFKKNNVIFEVVWWSSAVNVVHWRGDGLYSNDDVDVHGDDHDGIYLLQPTPDCETVHQGKCRFASPRDMMCSNTPTQHAPSFIQSAFKPRI